MAPSEGTVTQIGLLSQDIHRLTVGPLALSGEGLVSRGVGSEVDVAVPWQGEEQKDWGYMLGPKPQV